MGAISYKQVEDLRDAFHRHGVTYLFIGKTGAILHGFPDTTQDADVFVQKTMRNGFDVDLVFAPDGIERFEDAWRRGADINGFPVCSIDDIIASKQASNRAKDRETLPRLRGFREYLREPGREHHPRLPEPKSQDRG